MFEAHYFGNGYIYGLVYDAAYTENRTMGYKIVTPPMWPQKLEIVPTFCYQFAE